MQVIRNVVQQVGGIRAPALNPSAVAFNLGGNAVILVQILNGESLFSA